MTLNGYFSGVVGNEKRRERRNRVGEGMPNNRSRGRTTGAIVSVCVVALLVAGCGTRLSNSALAAGSQVGVSSPGQGTGGQSTGSGGSGGGGTTQTTSASGSGSSALSGTGGSGSSSLSGTGGSGAGGSSTGAASGGSSGGSGAAPAILPASINQINGTGCVPPTLSTIAIGNIGTYSGVIGAVAQNGATPVQVWADYANTCGGLDGHKVQIFSADDGGDPSTAVSEVQQMVQTDHVIAFVGDFAVLTGTAMDSYLEQNRIPEIGGDGVSTIYGQGAMWFPVTTGFHQLAQAGLEAAQKAKKTKIAILYCVEFPTLCGATEQIVAASVGQYGLTDVLNAPVSLTQPSFAAQCSQAQSAGAQVIFSLVDGAGQVREADNCATSANYHPMYVSESLSANTNQQSDPNLQGLYIPVGTFPWTDQSTPAEQVYHAQTNKYAPNEDLNATSSADWASGILAMQAAAGHLSATNPTSAQFLQGLYSIKNNNLGGLAPPITFTTGQVPALTSCFFAAQVANNKWTAPSGANLLCP